MCIVQYCTCSIFSDFCKNLLLKGVSYRNAVFSDSHITASLKNAFWSTLHARTQELKGKLQESSTCKSRKGEERRGREGGREGGRGGRGGREGGKEGGREGGRE